MKIALVSPYAMDKPGGVGTHIAHLRDEFVRLGHTVRILTPRGSEGGIERDGDTYGIGRTIELPGNGSKMRLTFDLTLWRKVGAIVRDEQFDIIHLHEPFQPVLPYMVVLQSDAVNVATFHAYAERQPWYVVFGWYMRRVLLRIDGRMAVSAPARQLINKYFPGDYRIVPNGVDVESFGPQVEPMPWAGDGRKRILFLGRFNENRKGFKFLLRAMPAVQQAYPDAELIVAGDGDAADFLPLIERLHVKHVKFMGRVTNEDRARLYASCDVACAPSTHGESFGYAVVEPMAAGRPVVASDIPGYASVMTSEVNGLLVKPADAAALADGLIRTLGDPAWAQALAEQAYADAQQYAWPRVAQHVLEAYDDATRLAQAGRLRRMARSASGAKR